MKKLIVKLIGISLLAFYFLACDDDDLNDPFKSIPTVQFKVAKDTVNENEGEKTVILSFNQPFKYDATIRLLVDPSNAGYFTSNPTHTAGMITIRVKKNDSQAILKLKPKNDATFSGTKRIEFKITSLHNEFILGANTKFEFIILDDDSPAGTNLSELNFKNASENVAENFTGWHEVVIQVSAFNTANGNAIIEAHSANAVYGVHYITEPALVNNQISLPVLSSPTVIFKIKPINDNTLAGDRSIIFTIKDATGNLRKGTILGDSVKVLDDELSGLPKGYQVGGGNWGLKKTYEYNTKGKISKVIWETYTPFHRSGVDTYYYNNFDQLIRINTAPGQDLLYSYVDARIFMEQKVNHGIIDRYTEYDYDEFGNVAGYQINHLQPDETFALSTIGVLLYFPSGNLYKKLVYTPSTTNPEEPYLVSIETFDNYVNKENPFPVVEVLPYVKTQKLLPSSYRIESNGHDLLYNFSYEFRPDGKVSKRTITGAGPTETAEYHYY
jgi:hypothetical protein